MKRGTGAGAGTPRSIMELDHILYLQGVVKRMPVADHVFEYAQKIVAATRAKSPQALDFCKKWLAWGAGPRAWLNLIMAAKAHAIVRGQIYVSCDDVAAVAPVDHAPSHHPELRRAERRRDERRHHADDSGKGPAGSLSRPRPHGREGSSEHAPRSRRDPTRGASRPAGAHVVEGYMAGEHRSPFRGFAIEFAQHREYVPGDDTRHLDWKVLGRTTAITSSSTSRRRTTSRTSSSMAASR